jgi:hypothetical protein
MILRSMFGRVLLLALAVGLGVPLTANATFTLTLSSGDLPDQVFTDSDGNGVITVSVSNYNGFSFQGDFATSNALSGQVPAYLTLTQASVRNWWDRGVRDLTITIEDDGFYAPLGHVDVTTQLLALDLFGNGDITTRSYLNGVQVGDDVVLNESGVGQSSGSAFIGGNGYTLKSVTTINLGQAGILLSSGNTQVTPQGNVNVSPVPAPSTAVMALAGVPVLGAFGWFRRRVRSVSAPTA